MKTVILPAKVGAHSLVGVGRAQWPDKPLDFGNYFSFHDPSAEWGMGPKCVNIWAENLTALADGIGLTEIEAVIFHNHPDEPEFAYITDDRIPKEWFIKPVAHDGPFVSDVEKAGMCITGCGYCCPQTKRELIAFSKERCGL